MNTKKKSGARRLRAYYIFSIIWVLGLLGLIVTGMAMKKEEYVQKRIASDILRFHVLANSDSEEDQQTKLEVRDAVLAYLEPVLSEADSRSESEVLAQENIEVIRAVAQQAAKDREIEVSLDTDWFPQKTYGDYTFPQGWYRALRVEIGEAKGHNWWCVLYPGLCFESVDGATQGQEEEEKLKALLGDDIWEFLHNPPERKMGFLWF